LLQSEKGFLPCSLEGATTPPNRARLKLVRIANSR